MAPGSSSCSSSSSESTSKSFTNSAWNEQKNKQQVEGKPSLDPYYLVAATAAAAAAAADLERTPVSGHSDSTTSTSLREHYYHHDKLLEKRIYPNLLYRYPTHQSPIVTTVTTATSGEESTDASALPKTELETAVLADCISTNFMFAHLPNDQQQFVLECFEKIRVRDHEIIFRQGTPAEYCYLLFQGEVDVEVNGSILVEASPDDNTRGEKYQVLGELALLTASSHSSTVKATTDCILFRLSRAHFQKALSPPEILSGSIEERIQLVKRACPPELLEYLEDDELALKRLVAGMTSRSFVQGEVLSQASGIVGFVIIAKGLAIATMEGKGYEDLSIGPGEAQSSYGWRMFAKDARVERRIVAASDGQALILTKEAFANAFGSHGGAPLLEHLAKKRLARIQLQQVPVFKDSELDTKQCDGLLDLMHHCEYSHSQDEIIMKAGQRAEAAMYFVREGCVTLEMNKGTTKQRIEKGSFFGEKNMLLDQNRDGQKHHVSRSLVTAIAHPNTKVDILYLEECRKVVNTRLLGLGHAPVSAINTSLQWSDIKRHKMLGSGSFGQVWLASIPSQDGCDATKDNKQMVALKVQSKHQIVQAGAVNRIMAECNVLASLHSPFVIRLYSALQDDGRLYMITSLLQGGELESLIPEDGLSEGSAKFYAAGILEGLTYMHRHHIVHRDIKPGNVLIDEKGYPVLIDMGFGKCMAVVSYSSMRKRLL